MLPSAVRIWSGRGSSVMNKWDIHFLMGHTVCAIQWIAFVQIHWAYMVKVRVRRPLLWTLGLLAGCFFLSIWFNVQFFSMQSVWLSMLFLLASSMLFEGRFNQKFVSSMVGGVIALLTQNMVRCIYSWATGRAMREVSFLFSFQLIMAGANLTVGFCGAYLVRRWSQKSALEPIQAMAMSFFPGVIVVLNIILMLGADQDKAATPLYLFLMPGFTMAVLVHVWTMVQFNDQVVKRRSASFRAELEEERATALLDSYTMQRRLTHEFTNHMTALNVLLEQGDVTGAREYISSVSKAVKAGTTIMNTHNPLLDSLLSKKYERAGEYGVKLFFDLCDLRQLPFSGTDLVIVFSNILDNALRAAAEANPAEVYVRARQTEEEFIISVRNRVEKDVELEEGQLPRSTKKEPGHGMGLENVKEALERYGGEYTLSCRDRWFRFTCSVPTAKYDIETCKI